MGRLLHYRQQITPQVELPELASPVANNASSLTQGALKSIGDILGVAAKGYRERQNARVEAEIMEADREFEEWRQQYMRENQGRDALNAQADFTQKYDEIMRRRMEAFGGYSNEIFQGELGEKLKTRGLFAIKSGGEYQRQQNEIWEKSVWEGKMGEYEQAVANHYNDPDRLGILRNEAVALWERQNPGQDSRAIRQALLAKADLGRVQGAIAEKNWNGAEALLAHSGEIGNATARFESDTEGVAAIGYDKTGGTSYGKWQLSSKQGSLQEWIGYLEKNGGAAIAKNLRAAGNANTGSRKGAFVEAYLKEARANPELFERTQREYLVQSHLGGAIKLLKNPAIAKMLNDEPALMEMAFSTAVQHGPKGAADIFNAVFKEGMGAADFAKAVYDDRGNHFKSSSQEVQASVKRRFKEEGALIASLIGKGSGRMLALSSQQRDHAMRQIEAGRRQEQAELRAGYEQLISDYEAKCQDGILADLPLSQEQAVAAYGAEKAGPLMERLNLAHGFAENYGAMKDMSVAERQQLLMKMKPGARTIGAKRS